MIAKKIDLAEIFDKLESLAEQIGLEGGIKGWETLAKQMEK